jgi:hypothetical protein
VKETGVNRGERGKKERVSSQRRDNQHGGTINMEGQSTRRRGCGRSGTEGSGAMASIEWVRSCQVRSILVRGSRSEMAAQIDEPCDARTTHSERKGKGKGKEG